MIKRINKSIKTRLWLALALVMGSYHQSTGQNTTPVFVDVAEEAGIDFSYTFGDSTYENILESSGSGITIFDYDNDGFMDVYLLNGAYLEGISTSDGKQQLGAANALYRNLGNGNFKDVSSQSGLDSELWSMSASPVDLDNDGFQDLYLLNYGKNIFFRNNADGTFREAGPEMGLEGPQKLNGFEKWSIGASFWDHDRDGLLDVMVGNFLAFDPDHISEQSPDMMPHPVEYKGQASMMYRQQKDGSFKEVTAELGLMYEDSKCMGLAVFDFDGDHDLDIFQANDHQNNFLFRNDQGKFKELGLTSGIAVNSNGETTGSMHATIGDVDGDGILDILVTDLKYGSLYRGLGNGLYEDITVRSGIAGPMQGKGAWGAALLDYDNDGDLDIISANGTAEELILQYPLLLENDGTGRFVDVGKERGAYFNTKRSGRGLAVVDYDNDGDLDVVINHVDLQARASLLKNEGGNANHWLGVSLLGEHGLASGMGARVEVSAGGKTQYLVNLWSEGYLSNNDPRLHIGIAQAVKVDRLKVVWPDGKEDVLENLAVDRYISVRKGEGLVIGK